MEYGPGDAKRRCVDSTTMTAQLNEIRLYSTEPDHWCGPTVISAITGAPIARSEQYLWSVRRDKGRQTRLVSTGEMMNALAAMGYMLMPAHLKQYQNPKPTLRSWFENERDPAILYYVSVTKHAVAVCGEYICCSRTGGQVLTFDEYPWKRCRVSFVFGVEPLTEGVCILPI